MRPLVPPAHYSNTFNITLLSFACFSCRKEIPLLDLISRGTNLSTQEASVITPLLSLFSSLLSNTLFSVHDNEFYGVEGNTKRGWCFLGKVALFSSEDVVVLTLVNHLFNQSVRQAQIGEQGMRSGSPPTNVAQVRFQSVATVCKLSLLLVLALLQGCFLGSQVQKPAFTYNFQFDQERGPAWKPA